MRSALCALPLCVFLGVCVMCMCMLHASMRVCYFPMFSATRHSTRARSLTRQFRESSTCGPHVTKCGSANFKLYGSHASRPEACGRDNAGGPVARGGDATWLSLQDFPQLDKNHVLAMEMQINPSAPNFCRFASLHPLVFQHVFRLLHDLCSPACSPSAGRAASWPAGRGRPSPSGPSSGMQSINMETS